MLIAVPASISFCLYSFDLLDILFSVQSSSVGADPLAFLSVGLCFLSTLTVINTALESKGKIYATVISLIFGCVVKLVASYALVGNSTIGVLGAPVGTVLSYIFSLAISLIFLEVSGIRTHTVAKIIIYCLIGIATFYPPYKAIYCTHLFGSSFFSMIISLMISAICYFVLLFLLYFLISRASVFKLHKKAY